MKDAKGHGSDSKNGGKFDETYGLKGGTPIGAPARPGATFPAHQQGVADAGRAAQFQAARQKQDQLEAESTRTGKALDSFTIGAKSLSAARAAWKQIGSPSQTGNFRLERRK